MDTNHKTPNEPEERLQALTEENLQLRGKNERLFTKVGYLESRLGHLASSRTDLSCRLVRSEEEKLKISKELVEDKIQTSKMREQFEEETFELKNKILNQAGAITELEMKRDNVFGELQSAEALLKMGEKSGQDLTEEYATLKKNYLALAEARDEELAQSDKLSTELLALARAQDALRRQLEEQQQSERTTTLGLHGELDRVRALISRMSRNRVKLEDLAALDKEQKTMEKTLLGNQDEIKDMLEKMKNSYEEQQKKREEKVVAMGKEHQENKRAIRDRQQELSEQSAALMCSQSQVEEAEEENSKLQLQLKELNEEYRARLVCYLRDLAEYIDGLGEGKGPSETSKMRAHVDRMLQDVRSSYRVREEQLARAARSYKKRLQKVTTTHHALLIAYRVQRDQVLAQMGCGLDPGPPEASFSLEPTELRGEPEKELHHLRQDKARLEGQLQAARKQVAQKKGGCPRNACSECKPSGAGMRGILVRHEETAEGDRRLNADDLISFLQKRRPLRTRATVAEAQVWELQDYIDNHRGRYKEEISRLCRLHGVQEAGRSQSANSSLHYEKSYIASVASKELSSMTPSQPLKCSETVS